MVAVGFLGLGAMGMPMAKRLLKGCSRLSVMDAKPRRVEALVEHGAVGACSETQFLTTPRCGIKYVARQFVGFLRHACCETW
eukprot:226386-Amphidinium_carterae.1